MPKKKKRRKRQKKEVRARVRRKGQYRRPALKKQFERITKKDREVAERLMEVLEMKAVSAIKKASVRVSFVRRSHGFFVFKVSISSARTRKSFKVTI